MTATPEEIQRETPQAKHNDALKEQHIRQAAYVARFCKEATA